MDALAQIGRLAMRQEGGNWNAYYAMADSMDGAIFLGSIRLGAVVGHPDRKKAFMNLMRDLVGEIIEDKTGCKPVWPDEPSPAPEHERAGNG